RRSPTATNPPPNAVTPFHSPLGSGSLGRPVKRFQVIPPSPEVQMAARGRLPLTSGASPTATSRPELPRATALTIPPATFGSPWRVHAWPSVEVHAAGAGFGYDSPVQPTAT